MNNTLQLQIVLSMYFIHVKNPIGFHLR